MPTLSERQFALAQLVLVERSAEDLIEQLFQQQATAIREGNGDYAKKITNKIIDIYSRLGSVRIMKKRIRGARSLTVVTADLSSLAKQAEDAKATLNHVVNILNTAKTIIEILKSVARLAAF